MSYIGILFSHRTKFANVTFYAIFTPELLPQDWFFFLFSSCTIYPSEYIFASFLRLLR